MSETLYDGLLSDNGTNNMEEKLDLYVHDFDGTQKQNYSRMLEKASENSRSMLWLPATPSVSAWHVWR